MLLLATPSSSYPGNGRLRLSHSVPPARSVTLSLSLSSLVLPPPGEFIGGRRTGTLSPPSLPPSLGPEGKNLSKCFSSSRHSYESLNYDFYRYLYLFFLFVVSSSGIKNGAEIYTCSQRRAPYFLSGGGRKNFFLTEFDFLLGPAGSASTSKMHSRTQLFIEKTEFIRNI